MGLKKYIGLTGGEIIYQKLIENHVKHVFGVIGGCNMPILDAFYKRRDIQFISTNHEQNAGHMAQGYARSLQKQGIVFGTSGPGSTNLVTPLQDAMLDSTPIIAITGQVKSHLLNTDAFQECDIVAMTKKCTKWNYQITNINELMPVIDEAFAVSINNRPGAVLIDVCKDISMQVYNFNDSPNKVSYHIVNKKDTCLINLKAATKLINNAKQPILYCGQGSLCASKEVGILAKLSNIPVTTTLLGLGTFNENDDLSLNMLGMHGSFAANKAMQESDLVIAVGARFDDRVTANLDYFIPNAKVIHIDIAKSELNKLVKADVTINADSKITLQQLLPYINKKTNNEWMKKINSWKKAHPFQYHKSNDDNILKPQQVIEELYNQTKDKDVIITTGIGSHQMFAAQFYKFTKPYTMITSGGLGTMGFGLPAAIGAKVGNPNTTVVDIDGDGSFNMTLTEMMTAVKNNINVKVMILNNNALGMVKQWEDLYYDGRHLVTTDINKIDYMKFADAVGCVGLRCNKQSDIKSTIEEMLKIEGPTITEFVVDQNEHCLPMVESHKALDEMILFKK